MQVDFGPTASDYAHHRAGFPESFRRRLAGFGLGGQLLDLGTGTGNLARMLNGEVTGVDPSEELLVQARVLDPHGRYQLGRAEATGLPDASFDWVTAGQCWHWFAQDASLAEIRRVLKPGGRLLVAYFDWLHEAGNPVDAMAILRRKHNPNWGAEWPLGFYPERPGDLVLPGFTPLDSFEYQEDIPYSHLAWRGRMRAYAGIGGSLPPDAVARFDEEFAALLAERFPEEPMQIPHKLWAQSWRS